MNLSNATAQSTETLVTELRRAFHQYPELSGCEYQTRERITDFLQQLGVKFEIYKNHCGVGGMITGGKPGPTIALRADMDALPIQEECDVPYKSVNPGVMHACGHDCHMAILLATAALLVKNKEQLAGTVKLVFQPSEEASPEGGAKFMLQEGFLNDVDAIYGLHVWPDLPSGHIGIKEGSFMAASDRFTIKLLGKDAHAGQPHKGIDAIAISATVINSLNHIISRQTNPVETATISIGSIKGGDRYNVIAREVILEGTIRTLDETVRRQIPLQMKNILAGITSGYGAHYEMDYRPGYPVLSNGREAAQKVVQAACKVIEKGAIHTKIKPALGAEDFAVYLTAIPGAFFWLGCSKDGEKPAILHNSHFTIDEAALTAGVNLFYQIALDALAGCPSVGGEQRLHLITK